MARHAKGNTASGRVLEKNGFSFVRECWDQKWSGSHRFECREYIWKSEKEEEKNSAARNEVERFYDDEYEEWDRLEWHTPEFEVTKRYMEEYIRRRFWILAAARADIPFFWRRRDMT